MPESGLLAEKTRFSCEKFSVEISVLADCGAIGPRLGHGPHIAGPTKCALACLRVIMLTRKHARLLSLAERVSPVLSHKVVDSLTKESLDTRISVQGELMQCPADGRTKIADHSLLSLARVSSLRGWFSQRCFLPIRRRGYSSRRILFEPREPTAHAAPRSALASLRVDMLTHSRTQAHREATSSAALPLGSISGAVLPAPTL